MPAAPANTTPALVVPTTRPASSGPASVPRLSVVIDAAFAATSSAGVVARDGRSAATVGRSRVEKIASKPARA